ncbi:MAG TPA: HBL/NHE enterotoxin family protein [Pyrinomonadaceae bacterium]|nr:HBL/NHE enterotoxin family protein [Pyrinomonadaceae bacterium]
MSTNNLIKENPTSESTFSSGDSSLQIDVNQTKAALQANLNTAQNVTNYAQATVTAVPRVSDPPDWFAPIQTDLETSQSHAVTWLKTICPDVTKNIPQSVVDFNDSFQSISSQILSVQQDIENAGGMPTDEQKQNVDTFFGNLVSKLSDQEKSVTAVQTEIKNYYANVESDQDKIGSNLGTVSARFSDSQTWIQQLTTIISENFLDTNILGPCQTIVEVNFDISLKISGVNADPTIITLILAKAVLQNQFSNQSVSEQAIQSILDTWTTFLQKVQAVIADLQDAQTDEYLTVLSQCDLQTAQTQWQQLSDFAATLIVGGN